MSDAEDLELLRKELDDKRAALEDMRQALPAHSMRPHQLSRVEELEEAVLELEQKIAVLEDDAE